MEVKVYQATLTIEGKTKTITKSIAKQFPTKLTGRWEAARRGDVRPEPIAKVAGKTLGYNHIGWLILVRDPVAGLFWTEPVVSQDKDEAAEWIERGGWLDELESIPTIIL